MGFFDELGTFLGEITSMSDELKQTAEEAVTNVTESTEELVAIKDELLEGINPPGGVEK
jgi:hypothetical protein